MTSFETNILTDFVTDAMSAQSAEDIVGLLRVVADQYGLDQFAISGLPLPGEPIDPYILLNEWPVEWALRYQAENHVHSDPVIAATRTRNDPFVWSENVVDLPMSGRARRVLSEASEFGMRDGFAVPIHGVGGLQAIVTFSSERLDLSEEMRANLQLIATFAHSRIRQILRRQDMMNSIANVTLREREILRWLASGKTVNQISDTLHLSASTIRSHMENLRYKLDCTNSAQLVAEGFRIGILR